MGEGGIIGVVRTGSYTEVCSLVGERRLGVYLYQSTHGIAPVQCALRSTQHVDAFYICIAEVESRLVYIRYVVYIKSY